MASSLRAEDHLCRKTWAERGALAWDFSWAGRNSQIKLYNQTHTQKRPHFLLLKKPSQVWGAAIFKAAPVSRSATARLHKPTKKRKKRSMGMRGIIGATSQKSSRYIESITISVHLWKSSSAFSPAGLKGSALCCHYAWWVRDTSGWILKQVLHQGLQQRLSSDWLQQLFCFFFPPLPCWKYYDTCT